MDMAKKFYEEVEQKFVPVQISSFIFDQFKNIDQLDELPSGLQDFYIYDTPISIEEFRVLTGGVERRSR